MRAASTGRCPAARRAAGARRRLPARPVTATSSTTSTWTPTWPTPWSPSSGARAWRSGCRRGTSSSPAWNAAPTTSGSPACTGSRRSGPTRDRGGDRRPGWPAHPLPQPRGGSSSSGASFGNPLGPLLLDVAQVVTEFDAHGLPLLPARMPRPLTDQRPQNVYRAAPAVLALPAQPVEQLHGLPVRQMALALDRVPPSPVRSRPRSSRPP